MCAEGSLRSAALGPPLGLAVRRAAPERIFVTRILKPSRTPPPTFLPHARTMVRARGEKSSLTQARKCFSRTASLLPTGTHSFAAQLGLYLCYDHTREQSEVPEKS